MESNETRWERFIQEACENSVVWTIEKDGQYCTSANRHGTPCFPWWSSRERVIQQLSKVPAYSGYTQIGFTIEQFMVDWVPSLTNARCLLGINYSGKENVGFDLPINEVVSAIQAAEQGAERDAASRRPLA